MTKTAGESDLYRLRRISSFARVILTANNYRVFDHLQVRGKTARRLAKDIAADNRAVELLLNRLVAIGFPGKKGNSYINTPVSSQYLISGKSSYQGDILNHYNTLWDNWSGLDNVLITGTTPQKLKC